MTATPSPWLTAAEAADYLRLSVTTLRNYTSRSLIAYHRNPHSGTARYHRDDLDSFLFLRCPATEQREETP